MKITLMMIFMFAALFPSRCPHDTKTCFYAKNEFNACNITCVENMNRQSKIKDTLTRNKIRHCHLSRMPNISHYLSARHLRCLIKSLTH